MSIEMISKRLKIISDLTEELRKIKALCDESLDNDPTFQKAQEAEKKVKEEVKEKKAKALESSTVKSMNDQIKELREQLKESKEALAQELADYYRESGLLEITDTDGNVKRIKFAAKLING